MLIDGRPLTARAVDAYTVVITFPAPYGPGLEMLDPLPILPRHRLVDALERGASAPFDGYAAPRFGSG